MSASGAGVKVLFLLLGSRQVASSRVRGYWLAEELERRGVRCTLLPASGWLAYAQAVIAILSNDCLVLQKRYGRWDLLLVRWANVLGRVTVLDIDDKYSATNHPATLKNIAQIMQRVSAVTVGSEELACFAREYSTRVVLLPSAIRLSGYSEKPRDSESRHVTLGWIGNGAHYAQDLLTILREPLSGLARTRSIRLKIVGACGVSELYQGFAGIEGLEVTTVDQIDWTDPTQVNQAMDDFDIGLYPLLDTDFNRHKCGFKALEYMAKGIPVVASPVGANPAIISEGRDGWLPDSVEDWRHSLTGLIDHPEQRLAMGRAGRDKVERGYSTGEVARQFLELLLPLLQQRVESRETGQ